MEKTFIVLLILVVWFSLHNKIGNLQTQVQALLNEIASLKNQLLSTRTEKQPNIVSQPVVVKEPEPVRPDPVKQPEPVPKIEPIAERVVAAASSITTDLPKKEVVVKPTPRIKEKKIKAPVNYEKFIGENLFGKIGILILVIGMGFFVKYAIDNNWINEVLRTILGFAVGITLLLFAWLLRKKYRAFSSVLAGGGFAIFYVTIAVAYHYYGLFSQLGAFISLVVLTVLMSGLSVFYNRRELAMIALVGGFIAPFLVSSGSGNYIVLFSYLMILNVGMFALSLYKKWGELPIVCFALTSLIFAAYLFKFDLNNQPTVWLTHLLIFATLFYLIFEGAIVPILQIDKRTVSRYLLAVVVLNNFVYLLFGLSLYWSMRGVIDCAGLIPLFIALVNICFYFLMRNRRAHFPVLVHMFLWMALTFVSIAIPIQMEGSMITLFWAAELMIVMWLYMHFHFRGYECFSLLLFCATLVSYLIDIERAFHWGFAPDKLMFLNGTFATGLLTGLSFLVFAFLLERGKKSLPLFALLKYSPFNAMGILIGVGVLYWSCVQELYLHIDSRVLCKTLIGVFTMSALFLFTVLVRNRFLLALHTKKFLFLLGLSVLFYMSLSTVVNAAYHVNVMLRLFQWASLLLVIVHGLYLGKHYYKLIDINSKEAKGAMWYFSILSTALLVITTNNLLSLLHIMDEGNASLSISLGIAGFVQMAIGMRLHLKTMRIISLTTFGVVLSKLVLIDLWGLPTIGKIIVFIILGIMLLVLSFLYQKLKVVLFDNDENTN